MSVVLFNSPKISETVDVIQTGGPMLRIGIASIAAFLIENGIDVSIMDPEADKLDLNTIKNKILKNKPEFIGIPAYTEEVHDAANIARAIKEVCPEIKILIGGPHSSAIPVKTLEEFDSFDIAVIGEGEQTVLEVVIGIELKKIKGIAFRDGNKIKLNDPRPELSDIDKLPYPAWELYDLKKYTPISLPGFFEKRQSHLELPIEGARGCPFTCAFCFRVNGRTIRIKSPKRIVDDIERCINEFNADHIVFNEGTFGVNKKIAIETCDEILKRGLHKKISWSTESRVDKLDEILLNKMKIAGCYGLGIGVESGDPQILQNIGKNITPEQSIKVFKICKKIGLKTEANFIMGFPFETKESIMKTIELAKKLEADNANFAMMVPFPGTRVYEMAVKNEGNLKLKTTDWRLYGKQLGEAIVYENFSPNELKKLQLQAYRSFYFRLGRVKSMVERLTLKRIIYGLNNI